MEQQAPKNKVYESFKTILIIVYFPFHILLTHFFRLFGRILRIFHKSKINNLADKILQYTEKEEYAKAIECCLEIIESIPKEYTTSTKFGGFKISLKNISFDLRTCTKM